MKSLREGFEIGELLRKDETVRPRKLVEEKGDKHISSKLCAKGERRITETED